MCRKLIYLMSFVLALAFFASQVSAASMGMDGYSDRVLVRNDGAGNALWFADATGPGGFGDGVAEVAGGAFGLMTDILMLGDVSGDGIADRVFCREVGGGWMWVADYSTATGFGDGVLDTQCGFGGSDFVPHALVDLDGDGLADKVSVQEDNPYPHYLYWGDKTYAGGFGDGMHEWAQYFGSEDNGAPIGMADLNNDGLADRVADWFQPDLFFVADFAPAGGGFGDTIMEAEAWRGGYGGAGMPAFVGDLNADGYADRVVVLVDGLQWECSLSSAAGFGTTGSDIVSTAGFGTTGDILLLGDVLVPEPATMMLLGLGGLALIRRKR